MVTGARVRYNAAISKKLHNERLRGLLTYALISRTDYNERRPRVPNAASWPRGRSNVLPVAPPASF